MKRGIGLWAAAALLCAAFAFVSGAVGADSQASRGEIFGAASTQVPAEATPLPPGFFDEPIKLLPSAAVAFTRRADGGIFLALKRGVVQLLKDGQISKVIDISDHVNMVSDRGLLGLTLDKDFSTNGFMYLAYVVENHGQPQSTDFRTASSRVGGSSTAPPAVSGAAP